MCVQLITTHLGTDPFVEFLKHKDEYSDEEGRNKHLGRVFQSLMNSLNLDFISQQIDGSIKELERNLDVFPNVSKENHNQLVDSIVGSIVLMQYLLRLHESKSGKSPFEQFEGNVSDILIEFPSLCRLFSDAGSNISPVINDNSNWQRSLGLRKS